MPADHDIHMASPWTRRFADLVAPGEDVLDLTCGSGRYTRLFLDSRHAVTTVDRDLGRVADLAAVPRVTLVEACLEAGAWPLNGWRYEAIAVCNYLHRPLLRHIGDAGGTPSGH